MQRNGFPCGGAAGRRPAAKSIPSNASPATARARLRTPTETPLLCDWRDLKIAAPTTLKDAIAKIAHSGNNARTRHRRPAFAAMRRAGGRVRSGSWSLGPRHRNSPIALGGSATLSVTDKSQWRSGDATTLRRRVCGKRLDLDGPIDALVPAPIREAANIAN